MFTETKLSIPTSFNPKPVENDSEQRETQTDKLNTVTQNIFNQITPPPSIRRIPESTVPSTVPLASQTQMPETGPVSSDSKIEDEDSLERLGRGTENFPSQNEMLLATNPDPEFQTPIVKKDAVLTNANPSDLNHGLTGEVEIIVMGDSKAPKSTNRVIENSAPRFEKSELEGAKPLPQEDLNTRVRNIWITATALIMIVGALTFTGVFFRVQLQQFFQHQFSLFGNSLSSHNWLDLAKATGYLAAPAIGTLALVISPSVLLGLQVNALNAQKKEIEKE